MREKESEVVRTEGGGRCMCACTSVGGSCVVCVCVCVCVCVYVCVCADTSHSLSLGVAEPDPECAEGRADVARAAAVRRRLVGAQHQLAATLHGEGTRHAAYTRVTHALKCVTSHMRESL